MKKLIAFFLFLLLPLTAFAEKQVLNLYAWTGEVPDFVVKEFEAKTGIKVNMATYENNEIMYAKLRATHNAGYDLVMPSSYFVDRMSRQGMLAKLNKKKLTNWHNLNPEFLHPSYDPNTDYSAPYIWGVTGIFVNKAYYDPNTIHKWSDLWDKRFKDSLMLLDDNREVFSMALLTLGYPANDKDPAHLQQAYMKLRKLMKNVKVFSTETVVSIILDEDANIGMAWNGDEFKAEQENPNIKFIFPEDGFVIWVDNFSIPKNAVHKDAAYKFINFILEAQVARDISLYIKFPTANLAGQQLLPPAIRNNPTVYPPKEVLKRGQFQVDLGEPALALYEKYWEELKMGG